MGLPYSKKINYAFDQVTPLVAAGFRILKTSRDIGILVALIQVLSCVLMSLILLAVLALVISVNPDMELERRAIVTPTMKWLASWVTSSEQRRWMELLLLVVLTGIALGTWAGCYIMRDPVFTTQDGETEEEIVGQALGTVEPS